MGEPGKITICISGQAEAEKLRACGLAIDRITKKFAGDMPPMMSEDARKLKEYAAFLSTEQGPEALQQERARYDLFEKEIGLYCGAVTTWPLEWRKGAETALFETLGDMVNEDKPREWMQRITADPAYLQAFNDKTEVERIFADIAAAIRLIRYIVRTALKLSKAAGIAKAFSQYIGATINGNTHQQQAATDEQVEAVFAGEQVPGGRLLWLGSLKDANTFTRYVLPRQSNGRTDYKAFEKYFLPFGRHVYSSNDSHNDNPVFVALIQEWQKHLLK